MFVFRSRLYFNNRYNTVILVFTLIAEPILSTAFCILSVGANHFCNRGNDHLLPDILVLLETLDLE